MRTLKLGENMLTCQKSKTMSRTQTFWFQIFCSNAPKCTWYLAPHNNIEKCKLIVNRPCHLWSQIKWQAKLDEPLRTMYSTFLFYSQGQDGMGHRVSNNTCSHFVVLKVKGKKSRDSHRAADTVGWPLRSRFQLPFPLPPFLTEVTQTRNSMLQPPLKVGTPRDPHLG